MQGRVNLWFQDRIPSRTQGASNSDGPDFIPNMEVFTVEQGTKPKGAVVICPGGAFVFRSVQAEGYDIADILVPMGYQCFVVNYRISPYTMQERATDLQRAIRYIRAHADDYGISPEDLIYYGLEYKYLTLYAIGKLTYEEMFAQLEIAIHQFAKRQMTWFRGMERRGFTIHWIDAALPLEEKLEQIENLLK